MQRFSLPTLFLLLFFVVVSPVQAQFATVKPAAAGFSPERLSRVDALLQDHVDRQQVAGVVTMVLRDGKAVHHKAFGQMDPEMNQAMRTDAIFRIASMSKAVTSIAVMMLYEEGRFQLNDPVYRFIPEFKDVTVAETAAEMPAGMPYYTVPAKRPITIRHLLTHTSGLTYGYGMAEETYREAGLVGWYFADKDETIGEAIRRMATLPLLAQPGDRYQYGYSTDVLGYLVEQVSGMPLDQFFAERIFKPLQMHDTYFYLPAEKANRLAPVYGLTDEGKLVKTEANDTTDYLHGPRKCFSGGAGLLSTASDYGRLLQMLLNGGTLDGVRLLGPKTVELMHQDHLGDKYPAYPGEGFGLGFWVLNDLGKYGELGTEGAYGWGSAYYPIYWIDPKERLIGIIMTQLRPTNGLALNRLFQRSVYQALVK
ncbi:CubicO group peptidase, beta-lactamase class C family [Catalinimonas alkaloidigena]|uniref:CubicO group peptidase, beta-lactamase class C family n=1 Tax=Catalinimonas alkaloidigena TaxID=1075417 RepID=A0A1G9SIG4_9BACT|nr:serine hydrolase domain-containing protein [Catalinimonas alkaloidigena]SDM34565.1 CubicO group peptidase, beta-lactamase class C family [Catalinimonas alkaloidigena]